MIYNSSAFGPVYLWINSAEFRFDEIIEWKNHVQRTKSGKDLIVRVRGKPRKKFRYTNSAKNSNLKNSIFHNLAHGPLVQKWGIANWGRLQKRTIPIGTTQILVDEKWPIEGLLLIWKSFQEHRVIEYYRTFENLVFYEPLDQDWIDSYIVPIEIGRIYNLSYRSTGIYGSFQFNLETDIHDNLQEEESDYSQVVQFNNQDVFFGFHHYSDPKGWLDQYDKEVDIFDKEIGRISAHTDKSSTRHIRKVIFYQESIEELSEFLNWIYRRAGRYRSFYSPSWNRDLEILQSDFIETEFYIADEYSELDIQGLAFRTTAGSWLIRGVVGISEVIQGILKVTLQTSLEMLPSEIERVSFLKQYALAGDEVEIRHFGNFNSECELEIEERF